jgi:hypothetical protein
MTFLSIRFNLVVSVDGPYAIRPHGIVGSAVYFVYCMNSMMRIHAAALLILWCSLTVQASSKVTSLLPSSTRKSETRWTATKHQHVRRRMRSRALELQPEEATASPTEESVDQDSEEVADTSAEPQQVDSSVPESEASSPAVDLAEDAANEFGNDESTAGSSTTAAANLNDDNEEAAVIREGSEPAGGVASEEVSQERDGAPSTNNDETEGRESLPSGDEENTKGTDDESNETGNFTPRGGDGGKQQPADDGASKIDDNETISINDDETLQDEIKAEELKVKTVGGLGIFLGIASMVFTAWQMSENPDGFYAAMCRLIITILGLVFRILLSPCRSCFGGSRNPHYGHMPVSTMDYGYRDPALELS